MIDWTSLRIDHVVINVRDAGVSAEWYRKVLGMRVEIIQGRSVLWFGSQKIHLRPIKTSQNEWFTAENAAAGSEDICFSTKSSLDDILKHFEQSNVRIERGPVQKDGALGKMMSVYCRDPDGSLIEVSTYF